MKKSNDSSLNEAVVPYRPATQSTPDLEFPDWNGQVAHETRLSMDHWLGYCRSNLARLKMQRGFKARRLDGGIPFEFKL